MKTLFTLLVVLSTFVVTAQTPGDTIVVETFNYTQTHGAPWDGTIRDTMIDFPDNPGITFEKVIMLYNMRCKDGLVSTTTERDKGCGEWDYSCNTYITDSSRVDSVLSFTGSHYISGFTGTTFGYIESPMYDYYQFLQQEVELDATNQETLVDVGNGNLTLSEVLPAENKSGKSQYLFTGAELASAGLTAGDIDALIINTGQSSADANYFKVRIKHTTKPALSDNEPDFDDFTEVYFNDYSFATGDNRIQFHTPFNWDGTSSIILEFSFTNHDASNPLNILGENTGIVSGIYSANGYCLNAVNGEINLPATAMQSISDEITISFWSYGNEKIQPVNNSIYHANDADNNRTVNMHLPWGNENIYFDCGNNGSSYDRINKAASPAEYEGTWSHWAVTKNTASGEMKIYRNGNVWHSGTDKTLPINIQDFILGSNGSSANFYFGKIDEFRVWDTELSETVIQNWMYKPVDATHPDYANLVAYYKLDEGSGSLVNDASVFAESTTIDGYMYWVYERGSRLSRGFAETTERPNITFAQGDYTLTISDHLVTDSVAMIPNIVRTYEIIPRYGTLLHDSINEVSVEELWEAGYQHIYNPEGILIDSVEVVATNTIEVVELSYYNRYPSKFEIMSFVTPYGIWLDLGMDGKTWAFDVTDYLPVLQGTKRMTVEQGGQWQEDMDIRFLFIVGTPPRDVLNINQLWRPDSRNYTDIIADRAFEARDVAMHPQGEQFKIRSVITGHGQQGEFSPRNHLLEIDGNEVFNWRLWTECSTNPIYPQGGTWIYDRAGWCPGQASDLYEYDITDLVTPGQTANINYGLEYANGTSNYIVNNQLVTYGGANFNLDASVLEVLKPNATDAKNDRFNPACDYPEIVIRNTGETTLTSLNIAYYEEGGEPASYTWTGSLDFMVVDTVALPVDDVSFWLPASNVFVVEVSNPNGQPDEYQYNNTYKTHFEGVDVYPASQIMKIVCKTNNYGWQTSYALYDGEGNLYLEWDNLDDNTVYETPLILPTGCYKLQINDRADDGLTWWHNSTQGTGYLRVVDNDGNTLYDFETEFGRFAIHEFGIGEITTVDQTKQPMMVASWPNPASGNLHVQIEATGSEKVSISMVNATGTVLLEENFTLNGGRLQTELNMSPYPAGIYFLHIESGRHKTVKKIVKQ